MKNVKKAVGFSVLTIVLACILTAALTQPVMTVQAAVKLNRKTAYVIKGQTLQLKVTGTKAAVKWSSAKKSVATVNNKGKVTGKKKGKAVITAKVGKKRYKCTVTVETPKISKTKLVLVKGEEYALKVSGTKQSVKWKSSKTSVVTVSSKGKLTAKKKGTAVITAAIGKAKYTCKVTVEAPQLNRDKLELISGEDFQLKVSGTTQKIEWSSNKENVASVSAKGKVTANGEGTAVITAKIHGKGYFCVVEVEEDDDDDDDDDYDDDDYDDEDFDDDDDDGTTDENANDPEPDIAAVVTYGKNNNNIAFCRIMITNNSSGDMYIGSTASALDVKTFASTGELLNSEVDVDLSVDLSDYVTMTDSDGDTYITLDAGETTTVMYESTEFAEFSKDYTTVIFALVEGDLKYEYTYDCQTNDFSMSENGVDHTW